MRYDAASFADWFPTFRNSAVVAATLSGNVGNRLYSDAGRVKEERIRHLQHCKNPLFVSETSVRFLSTPEWRWPIFQLAVFVVGMFALLGCYAAQISS